MSANSCLCSDARSLTCSNNCKRGRKKTLHCSILTILWMSFRRSATDTPSNKLTHTVVTTHHYWKWSRLHHQLWSHASRSQSRNNVGNRLYRCQQLPTFDATETVGINQLLRASKCSKCSLRMLNLHRRRHSLRVSSFSSSHTNRWLQQLQSATKSQTVWNKRKQLRTS